LGEVTMPNRILSVVFNDRESETRTPGQPLYVIPPDSRDVFAPMPPQPAVSTAEADFTRLAPGRPLAAGQVIEVAGHILDEDGRPVSRTLIEIWNANTHGRYSHSMDTQTEAPLDPNFYGFGRVVTDDESRYRLRTIKPGAYIARPDIGWWRPPHVHFSIVGSGVRLVTQMYFPDEALNRQDYIHMTIPETERDRVIATPGGANGFHFDIVVRGRYQTPPDMDPL
jgi:protocatechuate 3,4-dioxygenase, beta subunit